MIKTNFNQHGVVTTYYPGLSQKFLMLISDMTLLTKFRGQTLDTLKEKTWE